MEIKNAEFLISVADKNKILDLGLDEYVFVGRSNSGKSSLINFITNKKNLAKTSSTPGQTRLINYFLMNNLNKKLIVEKCKKNEKICETDGFLLVDLPGYGFSLAGKSNHQLWSDLIENYFHISKNIKKVFVLVDIRHEPSDLDKEMIHFLYVNQIPFVIVATKADKIAKSKIKERVQAIATSFKLTPANVIVTSSQANIGKNDILSIFA